MGSVAEPVSANGVRGGIVKLPGPVTSGAKLPVSVTRKPLLLIGPPLAVSPTNPLPPTTVRLSGGWSTLASVPPKVTWKPVSSKVPPAKPATAPVAPAPSLETPPLVVSTTDPVAPTALATPNGSASTPVNGAPASSSE